MRVPLSWLRELVELPAGEGGRAVAERLVRAGLEVESVTRVGQVSGPLVVGEVLELIEEPQRNGKTIRWCQVRVAHADGPSGPAVRGIVCGAHNFAVADRVVVALPGTVLPGGFEITARKTYGHVSDGMICSVRELGIGEEHSGILVLDPDAPVGADAAGLLGLDDEVLDLAVTPDRGYCLSVRGVAREVATAYDVGLRDPVTSAALPPGASLSGGYPVEVADPEGCTSFVAVTVSGFDPAAPSPDWLVHRISAAGMRSISLAVDVTNYVMLELGQPLHAYDSERLRGPIVVRRARPGERLVTLDDVERVLDPGDLLITDSSGPIGLAGVMGGASTEITERTRTIVVESAHFSAAGIARTSRRHRLGSEASRRFERGVDPTMQLAAAVRAAGLLARLGGGTVHPQVSVVGAPPAAVAIEIDPDLPARVIGRELTSGQVIATLRAVGAEVIQLGARLSVSPPPWRPDLSDPYDLVEEVARLVGYDTIPSVLPVAPPGRGLTPAQRRRRAVGRALAAAGFVEAPSYPFVGPADHDALGLPGDDPRRRTLQLANPIADTAPQLRTTLLPGLLATARRNIGRGAGDVALFEQGLVLSPTQPGAVAPRPAVTGRPATAELEALYTAVPDQPQHVGLVAAGAAERSGWWGPGRPVSWADAVAAARTVLAAAGVPEAAVVVRAARLMPWHPGRCAALAVRTPDGDELAVGHAGELHPRVVAAYGLPERAVAAELDLDAAGRASLEVVPAPRVSTYPVATQDVALVVGQDVPVAEVSAALVEGAGELLEQVRLFDVYTGEQVPAGHRSLAFTLRMRAVDRTLTVEEATAVRDAAVAEAARRTGASLRRS